MNHYYTNQQVYPERDITNIVESSHYVKIGSWSVFWLDNFHDHNSDDYDTQDYDMMM